MSKKIEIARQMLLGFIRERMVERNITQEQLALKTGFTQSNISRMLNAKYPPTLDSFLMLCEAAECYIFITGKDATDDTTELMRNRWDKPGKN